MKPSSRERLRRLQDQIVRCDKHYDEPEKYPVEATVEAINALMWRQLEIAESG